MASPLRPDGLASEFIEDIEIPEVRRSTADPVGELKQRLYAQPQRAATQLGDDLAQQSMLRNQAASRAASRAAYAPAAAAPTSVAAPAAAAKEGSLAARAASRLRAIPGAAGPRALAGKALGVVGKIATPLAAGYGAAQSFGDSQEYRDQFEGASSPTNLGSQTFGDNALGRGLDAIDQAAMPVVDSIGRNGLRVLGNIGNALTGGYAEKFGNVLTGGNISDPTSRERIMGGQGGAGGGAAIPTGGIGASAPIGSPMGSIELNGQQLSPERMAQLTARGAAPTGFTPGGAASAGGGGDDIRSVLRDMLNQGGGSSPQGAIISGQGGVSGQPSDFDKLRRDVIDAHGGKAQGTLAKKLIQIEELRQGRQMSDQRNATDQRGQDIGAQSALRANQLGVANTLADYDVQGQTAQAQQMRARAEAQKFQSEMGEKGFERFNKLTDGLFATTDADGKATNDTQKAERFRSFIMGSDPKTGGGTELLNLDPQAQAAAIQNLRTQFEIQEERNAAGGGFGAMTQNTLDAPVGTRDAALSDVFGRGLSAKDYVYSNLPFTDNEVVQTQSGQSRLRSDYVQDDADRLRELEKYAPRR